VLELAEPFPISLPAISRHLKVLERAGLISPQPRWTTAAMPAAGRSLWSRLLHGPSTHELAGSTVSTGLDAHLRRTSDRTASPPDIGEKP